MLRLPPPTRETIGLAVRWAGLFFLMLAAGWFYTAPAPLPQMPALFEPQATATFISEAAAQSGRPTDLPVARIDDTDTTHAALLDSLENRNRQTGSLSFALLRQTVLKRRPPPKFPTELAAMDGREVTMFGFMSPFDSLISMKTFMIMPVSTGCQFCAPPSPLEVILVRQKDARSHPYIEEPIAVRGRLNLWKKASKDEMHTMFLYVIDEAEVLPASQVP